MSLPATGKEIICSPKKPQCDFSLIFAEAVGIVNRRWSAIEAILKSIEKRYKDLTDLKEARKQNVPIVIDGPKLSMRLYFEVWTRGNLEFPL